MWNETVSVSLSLVILQSLKLRYFANGMQESKKGELV